MTTAQTTPVLFALTCGYAESHDQTNADRLEAALLPPRLFATAAAAKAAAQKTEDDAAREDAEAGMPREEAVVLVWEPFGNGETASADNAENGEPCGRVWGVFPLPVEDQTPANWTAPDPLAAVETALAGCAPATVLALADLTSRAAAEQDDTDPVLLALRIRDLAPDRYHSENVRAAAVAWSSFGRKLQPNGTYA